MKNTLDEMVEDARRYKDSQGETRSLVELCRREPEWAANRVRRLQLCVVEAFTALYSDADGGCLVCQGPAGMDDCCAACVALASLAPFVPEDGK